MNYFYLTLAESVLPNSRLTSCNSRVNALMVTMALRLCFAMDSVTESGQFSNTMLAAQVLIRLSPNLVALYWNIYKTHFFNKHCQLVFVTLQTFLIIYSLLFLLDIDNRERA